MSRPPKPPTLGERIAKARQERAAVLDGFARLHGGSGQASADYAALAEKYRAAAKAALDGDMTPVTPGEYATLRRLGVLI